MNAEQQIENFNEFIQESNMRINDLEKLSELYRADKIVQNENHYLTIQMQNCFHHKIDIITKDSDERAKNFKNRPENKIHLDRFYIVLKYKIDYFDVFCKRDIAEKNIKRHQKFLRDEEIAMYKLSNRIYIPKFLRTYTDNVTREWNEELNTLQYPKKPTNILKMLKIDFLDVSFMKNIRKLEYKIWINDLTIRKLRKKIELAQFNIDMVEKTSLKK